ncbi:hypothetical protein INR49_023380 [Caranx melampygus]|nr:hypothetical protein INR49_023380 [Caranx melampygus]
MLLLCRNDILSCVSFSPLISPHFCSSTHPLTSRANSTCLTRLSALWCRERGEGDADVRSPRREEMRRREKGGEEAEGERSPSQSLRLLEAGAFFSPPADGGASSLKTWLKTLNLHLFIEVRINLALDVSVSHVAFGDAHSLPLSCRSSLSHFQSGRGCIKGPGFSPNQHSSHSCKTSSRAHEPGNFCMKAPERVTMWIETKLDLKKKERKKRKEKPNDRKKAHQLKGLRQIVDDK